MNCIPGSTHVTSLNQFTNSSPVALCSYTCSLTVVMVAADGVLPKRRSFSGPAGAYTVNSNGLRDVMSIDVNTVPKQFSTRPVLTFPMHTVATHRARGNHFHLAGGAGGAIVMYFLSNRSMRWMDVASLSFK